MALFKGGGRIKFLVFGLHGLFFKSVTGIYGSWELRTEISLIVKVATDRTSSFPLSERTFFIALVDSTELTL